MLAGGPVHQVGDSGFYAVCSWDAVNDAIARPEDFSSNLTATMTYQDGNVGAFVMGELGGDIQALATADDPAHAAHRKLLVPQLAARRINALECSSARPQTDCGTKACKAAAIEWMSAMANRLPMMIVTRLIGVPDVDIDQLVRWGYASTQVVEGLVGRRSTRRSRRCGDGTLWLHQRTLPAGRRRSAGQSAECPRNGSCLRRIGRNRGADDDDHTVQRRRRVHRIVDRVCRAYVGEPSRHPTAGARKPGTARRIPRRGAAL